METTNRLYVPHETICLFHMVSEYKIAITNITRVYRMITEWIRLAKWYFTRLLPLWTRVRIPLEPKSTCGLGFHSLPDVDGGDTEQESRVIVIIRKSFYTTEVDEVF